MTEHQGRPQTRRSRVHRSGIHRYPRHTGVAVAALFIVLSAHAWAQSEDQVKTGLATWRDSGCSDCHGAFANGEKQRDEMPSGANLRMTKLDDAAIKHTITCGRPGTGMPSFDEGAYQTRPCNGSAPGARPTDLYPAPVSLTPEEIDSIVSYLRARVIGKGATISKQECLAYYVDDPDFCDEYK